MARHIYIHIGKARDAGETNSNVFVLKYPSGEKRLPALSSSANTLLSGLVGKFARKALTEEQVRAEAREAGIPPAHVEQALKDVKRAMGDKVRDADPFTSGQIVYWGKYPVMFVAANGTLAVVKVNGTQRNVNLTELTAQPT